MATKHFETFPLSYGSVARDPFPRHKSNLNCTPSPQKANNPADTIPGFLLSWLWWFTAMILERITNSRSGLMAAQQDPVLDTFSVTSFWPHEVVGGPLLQSSGCMLVIYLLLQVHITNSILQKKRGSCQSHVTSMCKTGFEPVLHLVCWAVAFPHL